MRKELLIAARHILVTDLRNSMYTWDYYDMASSSFPNFAYMRVNPLLVLSNTRNVRVSGAGITRLSRAFSGHGLCPPRNVSVGHPVPITGIAFFVIMLPEFRHF